MLKPVTLYRNSRSEASQIHVRMSRASKDFIHSSLSSPNPKKADTGKQKPYRGQNHEIEPTNRAARLLVMIVGRQRRRASCRYFIR